MNTKRTSDARNYYSIAIGALGIAALSNVFARDWLQLASGLCLLAAFIMLRAGTPNRSVAGKIAYFATIAGVFVLVTLSFVRGD